MSSEKPPAPPVDETIHDVFQQLSALIYAGADSGSIHQDRKSVV